MRARYYRNGEKSIYDVYRRVANFIGNTDSEKEAFYREMAASRFLPNSPTLMNSATELGILSACFVIPVEDSMAGIFDAVKTTALVHKEGGGTGMSFSNLRPQGSRVGSTGGISSGVVSFMEVFNQATESVKQGGCFVADTYIATARGAVKIVDLEEGDLVYSYDPIRDNFVLTPCTAPWMTRRNAAVSRLDTSIGLSVVATSDHPFLTNYLDMEYTRMYELEPGDRVATITFSVGAEFPVTVRNTVVGMASAKFADVYNVEVPVTHNYIVCDSEMRYGMVVSNTRRGANMGILDCDHPDLIDFIIAKRTEGRLSNFNISVMMTDAFIDAVKNHKPWTLSHPNSDLSVTIPDANEIFDMIAEGILTNGEPGVLFKDNANGNNTTPHLGELKATNPCGEQFLYDYESCNLGSINLAKFYDPCECDLDYDDLGKLAKVATRFLDNVIDKNRYPDPRICEASLRTRKIGLGMMGLHDLLLECGIPYDTAEARHLAKQAMRTIRYAAIEESVNLAKEHGGILGGIFGGRRGVFPAYKGSVWEKRGIRVRNAMMTTVAPTGTLSILAGCSSGIEPVFSWVYKRKNTVDKEFMVVHPIFDREVKKILYEEYVLETVQSGVIPIPKDSFPWDDYGPYKRVLDFAYEHGSIQQCPDLPDDFKRLFKSALDIDWRDHILMQAAVQSETDNSISKTINMPRGTTIEDIRGAILMAHECGCKGITIYVSGSRNNEVLALKDQESNSASSEYTDVAYRARSGCGDLAVIIGHDGSVPRSISIAESCGGCRANIEALCQFVSSSLQNAEDVAAEVEKIVVQLRKIQCPVALKKMASSQADGSSCAYIMGSLLERAYCEISGTPVSEQVSEPVSELAFSPKPNADGEQPNLCPSCKQPLEFGEGCMKGICRSCGWSGCN